MTISPMGFKILTPDQANPFGYGMQQGAQTRLMQLQAQKAQAELPYVAALQEQMLQEKKYANMLQKPRAEGAIPLFQAELAQKQAEAPYTRAQTGHTQALTKELAEKMRLGYLQNEMNYRSAQTGLTNEQMQKYKYERTHGLYDPELQQNLRIIQQMQAQANAQGSYPHTPSGQPIQPQPQIMMQQQDNMPAQLARYSPIDQAEQVMQSISRQIGGKGVQFAGGHTPIEQNPVNPFEYMQVPAQQMMQIPQQMPVQMPQQMPMQVPQQVPPGMNQGNIPGSNVPMQDAVDALIRHAFHIPNNAANDPIMQKYREALIKNMEFNQNASAFKALPVGDKQSLIAQARAFGLSESAASKRLLKGESIEDIAQEKGFDRNNKNEWPLVQHLPTTATKTQQQRANIARAGRNAVEPLLTEALAPFAGRIKGYSPKMILDATKGLNPEERGKALAAAYMQTEMQALSARAVGIQNIGINMMRDMLSKSSASLRQPGILIDEPTFKAQQKWMTAFGNIVNRAENEEAWGNHAQIMNEKENGSSQSNEPQPGDLTYDPNTGELV